MGKKQPSQKQLRMREVADMVSKCIGRDLDSSEWGMIGKMINTFGFDITKDAAESFVNAKLPLVEKKKCVVPYMYGCLKRSKVAVDRDDTPIADILGEERGI
jgi:hypothetical protein